MSKSNSGNPFPSKCPECGGEKRPTDVFCGVDCAAKHYHFYRDRAEKPDIEAVGERFAEFFNGGLKT